MSEKIYALLLRLYPARFRARYGEESLQLFRDRLRDETGLLARLRLIADLLTDTALALPRAHMTAPAISSASASPMNRLPSFGILDRPPLRRSAIIVAAALSLTGTTTFFLLLNYAGVRAGSRLAALEEHLRSQSAVPPAPAAPPAAAPTAAPAVTRSSAAPNTAAATAAGTQQDRPAGTPEAGPTQAPIDPAELHRVVTAVAQNLRQHYFDPALAQNAAATLLAQEKLGADNAATPSELAALLTHQIRSATGDWHLIVVYSANPLPTAPPAPPSPADLAAFRQALLRQNCFIGKVAMLPHNIGYLKLDAFPDPAVCRQPIVAALFSLNSARAIIFDLRDNRGGLPDMVADLAAPLFDHPVPWYNPRATTSAPSWTASPVPGSRLAQTPVYILTSPLTFSGAEQFTYNLKMLHRATVVGQTTGGAAHAGTFHRIDDHYGMGIPETRIVNPYASSDWASVGVTPNVPVQAADALTTAEKLAEAKLHR